MIDTSPPILSAWSGPAAPACCLASRSPARMYSERLQRRLETRLQERLNGRGSMIYQTAWKQHTTPLGRQIFRLRASALRTSVREPSSVPSGWPTHTTRDWKDGANPDVNVPLNGLLGRVVWLAGWPTPMAGTPAQNGNNEAGNTDSSRKTVALAGWPTTQASDGSGGGQEKRALNPARSNDLMDFAMLAGWPTPNAGPQNDTDSKWEERREKIRLEKKNGNGFGMTLGMASTLSGWPTPNASDGIGGKGPRAGVNMTGQMPDGSKVTMNLPASVKLAMDHEGPARLTASGHLLTGSCAGMSVGGQLNPAFSAWLMGYPEAWCRAALSCQLPTRSPRRTKTPAG